ncbi:MAG: tetratricopeptide repeat protein [Planctomycetota bacterium]|jgi:tetratricopeptide (TPR) repeat protein
MNHLHAQSSGIAGIVQQAIEHHRAGDLEEAEALYLQVLGEEPDNAAILHLLGALAHQKGRHDVALDFLGRAIASDESVAEFHNTLGVVLQGVCRQKESLAEYRQAILLRPDYAEAHNNMGRALQNLGKCSQAIEHYRQAARLAPDCAEIHYNLGSALQSEGRHGEAADNYRRALKLRPTYAQAFNNLGISLKELGRFQQAIQACNEAIRLEPGCLRYHCNLASILQHQGRLAEALVHCERAASLEPDSAEVYHNMASVLRDLGRCDEAVEQNRRAIRLRPEHAETHWNQAVVHLLNGAFSEGWKQFEWRRKTDWHTSAYPHEHRQPRWSGESLAGKRLLVHCEQGLGDCIQFVRYLPMIKALGATVVFEAWPSLCGLLREFDEIDELVELSFETKTQAKFDLCTSVMDLPGIFGTTEQTIPACVPYIHADPARAEYWGGQLAGPDLKVGVVWAGSARHANDHNRSCRLEHFAPVGRIEGIKLYGLQKGEPARQVDESAAMIGVENLADRFEDFTDAAAAIENLDMIISVDTAVLHLAGAMGKCVWALLPYAPDWRWMLVRSDSPWYPTMKLFRQERWGDWSSVLKRVAYELRGLVRGQRSDIG